MMVASSPTISVGSEEFSAMIPIPSYRTITRALGGHRYSASTEIQHHIDYFLISIHALFNMKECVRFSHAFSATIIVNIVATL